jgi:IS5 family transposase
VKNANTGEPAWSLSQFALSLQGRLFQVLEDVLPGIDERYVDLALHLDYLQVETTVAPSRGGPGRKPKPRGAIFRAFMAKAFWNLSDGRALRDLLLSDEAFRTVCGFRYLSEVPSESTMSRALEELAASRLADELHADLVRETVGQDCLIEIYRDSTAINAREKPLKKPQKVHQPKKKRGRKPGGETAPAKEPTRLERQLEQSLQEAIAELPTACDIGAKKNSKGHNQCWIGYKMHADVTECGLPISVITTSASVHDSQVAIPLMRMTSTRARTFYQLMDAGYTGSAIIEAARRLDQVAIVKPKANPKNPGPPLDPHRARRLASRWQVEQFFSWIKERFGARHLLVKGHCKVHFHLMCAVLAAFAYVRLRL